MQNKHNFFLVSQCWGRGGGSSRLVQKTKLRAPLSIIKEREGMEKILQICQRDGLLETHETLYRRSEYASIPMGGWHMMQSCQRQLYFVIQ